MASAFSFWEKVGTIYLAINEKGTMRIMPTKLHAYLDYTIALISILSPVLFGFGEGKSETLLPICFGLLLILYSFCSDYELGLSRQIPMYVHLRMDQLAAILLITSPWVFKFYEKVYLPHVLLGLILLISSLLAGNEINAIIQAIRQRSPGKMFRMLSGNDRVPSGQ